MTWWRSHSRFWLCRQSGRKTWCKKYDYRNFLNRCFILLLCAQHKNSMQLGWCHLVRFYWKPVDVVSFIISDKLWSKLLLYLGLDNYIGLYYGHDYMILIATIVEITNIFRRKHLTRLKQNRLFITMTEVSSTLILHTTISVIGSEMDKNTQARE